MNYFVILTVVLSALFSNGKNDFYTMEDFADVKKIDAHYHVFTAESNSMEQAAKDNFRLFAINTNTGSCENVFNAHKWLEKLSSDYPESFQFATTFCLDGWDDPQWTENTLVWLKKTIAEGAVSVKVWKNIGMEFRDKDSVLIMIDDEQFDPIFSYLAENDIPVVGHLGEPKACWQPLDEIKVNNNKSYFKDHPEYHMYLHPEYPSYEEQMEARDRMLDKNPDLVFIGCHLASLEWDVDVLAKWLDKYPNACVDMAARMGDLFYQTSKDYEKVRNFFINYQDRLLYGTDLIDQGGDATAFHTRMHEKWILDWEYMVTANSMSSNLIDGEFKGLKLPKKVVDKIYYKNTIKWYKCF